MKLLVLILSFASISATAQVKYLEQGQQAPFTGYLFSPDKEQEARQNTEAVQHLRKLDEYNQKIIQLKDEEIQLINGQKQMWQKQSEDLSKQLQAKENSGFWKQTLYFGLGALVTTALAYGVNQATK